LGIALDPARIPLIKENRSAPRQQTKLSTQNLRAAKRTTTAMHAAVHRIAAEKPLEHTTTRTAFHALPSRLTWTTYLHCCDKFSHPFTVL